MDFLAVVGANVRALREARGLPQDELAHLASIHPSYMSDVENGKRNFSLKVLERIAVALRVPETDLVIRR
ncbi:Cro/Cl family transcriptional regulator [Caulobacter sp. Root1455]|uniref:helix-turn-helix domain-containing protein n=1 Tax=unclassified Caulobacter TaxID=2648921 RepID=UPI0006F29C22|nr:MULTISPECIES: helix-turn-helix transcriptional regulator [unclassified Caulobacter]KQY28320.1 Cro/Cl family transcriptional regulator [Caulobacter sp. Root487D2Y]KQY91793.1 Cro/Cl family transcriptional regulator [Caulobacter sp. Root1455]